MDNRKYILDANVFIEASRRYYAFDLAPPFWDNLIAYAESDRIISIDRIKQELERGRDELAEWAKNSFHQAFASTDEEGIINSYADIMKWVNNQAQFTNAAKADFANSADGWLVACAIVKKYIVVTHEVYSVDVKVNVPIPNICRAFNIECIDTFQMLRNLGVKFK